MTKFGRPTASDDTGRRYLLPVPPAPVPRRRGGPSIRVPSVAGAGASAVGALAGLLLVASVFMPWYATNLGPPFSATSASGWDATAFAKIALLGGLVLLGACVLALLDERDVVPLAPRHAEWLAWAAIAGAAIALLAIAFRTIWLPEPAEFLSRQVGLYLAGACALVGVLSGLGQVAERS